MRTRSQSSVLRTVFVLALATLALAVPAANAHNSTYEVAWTFEGGYPGYLTLVDLCGGSGTMQVTPIVSSFNWDSDLFLRPRDMAPIDGLIYQDLVRGSVRVTWTLTATAPNGVTYTGSGKTSTRDFPNTLEMSVSLSSADKLRGSDGSVLEVGQTWQTQYNSGIFFDGRFQDTPVVYFTGESCLKQAH